MADYWDDKCQNLWTPYHTVCSREKGHSGAHHGNNIAGSWNDAGESCDWAGKAYPTVWTPSASDQTKRRKMSNKVSTLLNKAEKVLERAESAPDAETQGSLVKVAYAYIELAQQKKDV